MRRTLAIAALVIAAGCTVRVDVPEDIRLPDFGGSGSDALAPPDVPDAVPWPDVPTQDVARPRDAFARLDLVRPADVPVADASTDIADTAALPELRYCPWPVADLPLLRGSALLAGEDFLAATTQRASSDGACGDEFPSADQPERVYLVDIDGPARLGVRARCLGFDCDIAVLRNDCLYSNVALCLTEVGDERGAVTVPPDVYVVVVEPRPGLPAGPFDLQLAVRRDEGYATCPVDGEVRLSTLAAAAPCVPGGARELVLSGDTAAPGARDRFHLACVAEDPSGDSFGGAPDAVWRIVADAPDGLARTLAATVVPTDGAFDAFVAVTGSPCGGTNAIVDCGHAPFAAGTVADVTLFDDEEVFVIVDGNGERLLDGQGAGPFELRLRISDPSCAPMDRDRLPY